MVNILYMNSMGNVGRWNVLFGDPIFRCYIVLVYRSVMVPIEKFYYQATRWQWIPSRELKYPIPKVCLKMTFPSPRWDMLVPQEGRTSFLWTWGFSRSCTPTSIYLRDLGIGVCFLSKAMVICPENKKKHRLEKQGYAIKVLKVSFSTNPGI